MLSFQEILTTLMAELSSLYDSALPVIEQVSHISQGVVGLLAFLYLGYQLWGQWARGESIDFYLYLKPFAIGIIILFFGAFTSFLQVLVSPLQGATSHMGASVYQEYTQNQQAYEQAHCSLRNALALQEREQIENEAELPVASNEEVLSSEEQENWQKIQQYTHAWAQISQLAVVGIVLYFQIFTVAAQLILLLVGPFAFALSLFPGFAGNIQHWIAHYLQLLLYSPLLSFLGFIVALLLSHVLYAPFVPILQQASELTADTAAEMEQIEIFMQATVGLFHTLAFVLYTRIPTFSRWLIQSVTHHVSIA